MITRVAPTGIDPVTSRFSGRGYQGLLRATPELGSDQKQVLRQAYDATYSGRALFEYLALELSPTKQGDALITIELERAIGLDTQSHVSRLEFEPDPLEAGLSAA